jgi:hypothetical protein
MDEPIDQNLNNIFWILAKKKKKLILIKNSYTKGYLYLYTLNYIYIYIYIFIIHKISIENMITTALKMTRKFLHIYCSDELKTLYFMTSVVF